MVFIQILEQVINGLLVGAYYLLIALGLSLIFSLGGLVNLAHGAFYALGAYFAVKLADHLGFAGALVALAGAGRADRPRRRALPVPALLPRGSGAGAAAHVRPRDGRRADAALDLRRGAASRSRFRRR